MAIVPQGVAVLVGEAWAGRVIVTVDRLDGAVRIGQKDGSVGGGKEGLKFQPGEIAAEIWPPGGWEGFVDVADQDAGRMSADQTLHLLGLAHRFTELWSAQVAE